MAPDPTLAQVDRHLGFHVPREQDFDAYCAIAARLVAIPIVAQWVKSSFPIMIVDEAQDLCVNRGAIVSALSATVTLILGVRRIPVPGA